jgi:Fe-S-cluster-containing hydrogenase component 2
LRSADTAKCARYCVSTAVSLNRNVHGFNASRCIQ